jgi:hypothetical protein
VVNVGNDCNVSQIVSYHVFLSFNYIIQIFAILSQFNIISHFVKIINTINDDFLRKYKKYVVHINKKC